MQVDGVEPQMMNKTIDGAAAFIAEEMCRQRPERAF